ncbi:hypothetical protein D3C87_2068980 [compost metagenome]
MNISIELLKPVAIVPRLLAMALTLSRSEVSMRSMVPPNSSLIVPSVLRTPTSNAAMTPDTCSAAPFMFEAAADMVSALRWIEPLKAS